MTSTSSFGSCLTHLLPPTPTPTPRAPHDYIASGHGTPNPKFDLQPPSVIQPLPLDTLQPLLVALPVQIEIEREGEEEFSGRING